MIFRVKLRTPILPLVRLCTNTNNFIHLYNLELKATFPILREFCFYEEPSYQATRNGNTYDKVKKTFRKLHNLL